MNSQRDREIERQRVPQFEREPSKEYNEKKKKKKDCRTNTLNRQ
jgi:hypothetical protein